VTTLEDWPTPDGEPSLVVQVAVGNTISMVGWVTTAEALPDLLERVAEEMRKVAEGNNRKRCHDDG
jgi:hypothetical protein